MRHLEKTKKILRICGILLLFCCFKAAIGCTVCSSFFRVFIDARFERPEQVQVFYGVRPHFVEARSKKTAMFPAGERMLGATDINNHAARHLRIDLGEHPGVIRLYGLRLNSFFFRREARFAPADIVRRFTPGPGVTMRPTGDHVELLSETDDPHIRLQGVLKHRSLFLEWVLPLVMALSASLLLSGFSLGRFPALADLLGQKQSSAGLHFAALDGIRGFAALTVLGVHVGALPEGIGIIGVLLFFSLSGFLLAIPFARDPGRGLSPEYMRAYMKRRLLRIIPMYYTVITVLFLFRHRIPDVFRHYLFLQGDGYLWTVPQEMFFYILLPALVAALCALAWVERGLTAQAPAPCRRLFQRAAALPGWLGLAALLVAIVAATWMAHHHAIILYGNGESRTAMVGIFMSGMFFSLLYRSLQGGPLLQGTSGARLRRLLGLAGAGALLFLALISYRLLPGFQPLDIYKNFGYTGFLAAFIIFSVITTPDSLLAKCMGWTPLRAVGVVSFSFYLLHPTAITFCRETARYFWGVELGAWPLFLVVTLTAYAFSTLTYSWIERPFMKQ